MEFTKIMRGRFHVSGWERRSGRSVKIESLLKGMAGNAAKALGETLGVTMVTAPRDLGAACHRVPGCVRPLDCRFIAHNDTTLTLYARPRATWLSQRWYQFIGEYKAKVKRRWCRITPPANPTYGLVFCGHISPSSRREAES